MSVDELRPLVRQLADIASQHVFDWMDVEQPDADTITKVLPAVVAPYTESAALLTADWYDAQDPESRFNAVPTPLITDERIANTADWAFRGPQDPANRMKMAANGMVFEACRNTVVVNAHEEKVAFIRHAQAGACVDCRVAATLTPVARNSRSDHVVRDCHHGCGCVLVPVRKGVYTPPGYVKEWHRLTEEARRAGHRTADSIAKYLSTH